MTHETKKKLPYLSNSSINAGAKAQKKYKYRTPAHNNPSALALPTHNRAVRKSSHRISKSSTGTKPQREDSFPAPSKKKKGKSSKRWSPARWVASRTVQSSAAGRHHRAGAVAEYSNLHGSDWAMRLKRLPFAQRVYGDAAQDPVDRPMAKVQPHLHAVIESA